MTTRGSCGWPALGRERRHSVRDAVIGVLHDQAAIVAGGQLRHAPGHIVRLAAGIDEDAGVEMRGQRRGELFGVLQNARHADSACASRGLPSAFERRHDRRMGMADMRHVVVDVEVCTPLRVVQPDPGAAHDVQRASRRKARRPRPSADAAARGRPSAGGRGLRPSAARAGPAAPCQRRVRLAVTSRAIAATLQRFRGTSLPPSSTRAPRRRGGFARHAPARSRHGAR